MSNSILSFEFYNKSEAIEVMNLYVEKASMISFYSYIENPFNYENNTIHPQKPVRDSSLSHSFSSMRSYLYRRKETPFLFSCYRSSVRNHRYFSRK